RGVREVVPESQTRAEAAITASESTRYSPPMRRFAGSLLLLAACGDGPHVTLDAALDASVDASDYVVPEGCNPLAATWDCMLPFPSDHFLVDDPSLPSGRRVELPEVAQVSFADDRFDPFAARPVDGFS